MKKEIKGNIASLIMSLIMGLQYVFVKNVIRIAQNQLFFVLFVRFLIGFIVCVFVFRKETVTVIKKIKENKNIGFISFFHPFLNYTFQIAGVALCPVLLVSILISFVPVVNSILSVIFLKEKLNKKQIVLLILSSFSAILVSLSKDFDLKKGVFLGIIFIIISIISRGVYSIKAKKLLLEINAKEVTCIQIICGFVLFSLFFIFSLFVYKDIFYLNILLNKDFILGILYLSILSTVIVFLLNNIALKYLTVSNAGLLNSITSVVSAFAGVIFLKEEMNVMYIVGFIIIVFSSIFYNRSFNNE